MTRSFRKTLAVLSLALIGAAPRLGHAETLIARFSGTGDAMTETFTVSDNWSARWKSEGARFALVLHGANGGTTRTSATVRGHAEGEAAYSRGGTYTLEVTAEGPWRVDIVSR